MRATEFFAEYVLTLSTTAASAATTWLTRKLLGLGIPAPLLVHFKELKTKMREMPFIYRDLESGDILHDYVDVDLGTFDIESLKVVDRAASPTGALQRMHDRHKALLLGNPGIGKTTFVRHTILQLMTDVQRLSYLPRFKFVPFYVPLKAVDASGPYPILRYLLANNSYLSGNAGLRRPTRLAATHRLFLFLDGYDEIFWDVGANSTTTQHIRAELELLVGGKDLPREFTAPPPGYEQFYKATQRSRVWLTSRREFFAQNRIDLSSVADPRKAHLNLVAIALLGVGTNRLALANRVFEQYRRRSAIANEILSGELLLSEIDNSPDARLSELSYNPLFLTVMCYLYAHAVMSAGSPHVDWSATASTLVASCVQLLLNDLDEYKVRSLPAAQRLATMRRRNMFPLESASSCPTSRASS